jgi:hypothetical protein
LHFHEILPAESTGLADAAMGLPRERTPLFDAEKQQNTLIPALRRQNEALQVVDFICVSGEFRYAAKQRNFFGLSAELFGRTVELQRNLSARRISRGNGIPQRHPHGSIAHSLVARLTDFLAYGHRTPFTSDLVPRTHL